MQLNNHTIPMIVNKSITSVNVEDDSMDREQQFWCE